MKDLDEAIRTYRKMQQNDRENELLEAKLLRLLNRLSQNEFRDYVYATMPNDYARREQALAVEPVKLDI